MDRFVGKNSEMSLENKRAAKKLKAWKRQLE
jgi:hypothetical protein